ncbi:hypothetical protein ACCO45_008057 [Purpureocillium lilacinum]|uniref:Uncharacterized protein n=1 Tax=Purpureocillium lilacinum TaxID=33203 RepID=A0ACC4DPK3_PURLI
MCGLQSDRTNTPAPEPLPAATHARALRVPPVSVPYPHNVTNAPRDMPAIADPESPWLVRGSSNLAKGVDRRRRRSRSLVVACFAKPRTQQAVRFPRASESRTETMRCPDDHASLTATVEALGARAPS